MPTHTQKRTPIKKMDRNWRDIGYMVAYVAAAFVIMTAGPPPPPHRQTDSI